MVHLWRNRPLLVIATWSVFLLLVGVTGMFLGLASRLPGPGSTQALLENPGEQKAIEWHLPKSDDLLVVLGHPSLTVDTPEFISAREALTSRLRNYRASSEPSLLFPHVQTMGHTWLDPELFVAKDRQHLLIRARTSLRIDQSAEAMKNLPTQFDAWQAQFPEFRVSYLSEGSAVNEMFGVIERDLDHSLIFTLPLTLLILLWAFRTIVAAILPLAVALLSLGGALGFSALLSQIIAPVSATASQLVVLLVLAIGVDYSLFFISRMREEVRLGHDYEEAIRRTLSTTGLAILWSGVTVGVSLLGLFIIGDVLLDSMALVSIVAVLLTVISCLTILPPLLLLLGPRIEWGALPLLNFARSHKLMLRWITLSVSHPIPVLAAGMAFMLVLSIATLHLRLGTTVQREMLPQSMQSSSAFKEFSKNFPLLVGTDFSVVIWGNRLDEREQEGELQPFFDSLTDNGLAKGPRETETTKNRQLKRYHFSATHEANAPQNQELIARIRNQLFPKYIQPLGLEASVSGTLPFVVDDVQRYSTGTGKVLATVLFLCTFFLLIAFRSVAVPLKAILLNLLSTTASFGVLVLVFQFGPLPEWRYGVIEGFVPALLFAILFGLSMDYHVFLLSRVREEVSKGLLTKDAVRQAIIKTSSVISSAALIMVSVFLIIASLEMPLMKQLGVGLAVAVFLDATVIRTLLLPASMVLLGTWNWYLPEWLRWLPKIRLD